GFLQARNRRARRNLQGAEAGRRMARGLVARAVPRAARARHGAAGLQPAQRREARRHLPLRRLRRGAVRRRHEVRERHRLAELLGAHRGRGRHPDRPQPVHDAHGSPLRPLRRAPRPRLPGRAEAHRPALLHERRGHALRAQGGL
ncbi:MAG: Peptide-methionine (R)-S-oxide reductase MsrB, partial [uncultured Acetobacteraceae bacterium]